MYQKQPPKLFKAPKPKSLVLPSFWGSQIPFVSQLSEGP